MNDPDFKEFIERVRTQNPIEDVIAEYGVELRREGNLLVALCPFKAEDSGSFKVYHRDAKPHYFCFGCTRGGDVFKFVMEAYNLDFMGAVRRLADRANIPMPPLVKGVTPLQASEGLTVEALAGAKKIPIEHLATWGVRNARRNGFPFPVVAIPYFNENGETMAVQHRLSLTVEPRFLWRTGDHVCLYGLNRLGRARELGYAIFVEGASDCWAAWLYDLPVFGIPGKSTWRSEWASKFEGLQTYLWQEPKAEDLTEKMSRDFPNLRVIEAVA